MDGINAARLTLPLCHFDRERTAKGVECLREYKAEWDEKARVFRKTPKHDWASHGADGFRTLANAWRLGIKPEVVKPKPIGLPLSRLTMNQLHELEDAPRRAERV